jgi:hypothetical protein
MIHSEDAVLRTTTIWNSASVRSSDASAKSFKRPPCGVTRKLGISLTETVEKSSQHCRSCTRDICKYNYKCHYSFWEKTGGMTLLPLIAYVSYKQQYYKYRLTGHTGMYGWLPLLTSGVAIILYWVSTCGLYLPGLCSFCQCESGINVGREVWLAGGVLPTRFWFCLGRQKRKICTDFFSSHDWDVRVKVQLLARRLQGFTFITLPIYRMCGVTRLRAGWSRVRILIWEGNISPKYLGWP